MKAAFVLLADYKTQNFLRKIVFALEQNYQIDFCGSLLPAHVSLKQPFAFENMEKLEPYFDALAASIPPFMIELDEIYYTGWQGYGILGVNVKETSILRELHNRLNWELPELVQDASAPHDGDKYHFHMTIELGKTTEANPFRDYFDKLTEKRVNLAFLAQELALFYYTGKDHLSYFNYKVLPLTGKD
jgi:2'-5' RNA ligase